LYFLPNLKYLCTPLKQLGNQVKPSETHAICGLVIQVFHKFTDTKSNIVLADTIKRVFKLFLNI